ncbi:MAG: NAD(P)/FAD-dependent oxidoreductase [Actinobacteria bacterium]|nr:NAD(P)/FAD-dependent oxidoreductase [Actinomycetota bacterium]
MSRPDLRARYAAERDKRLRPDGNDQYLEPTGRFASLLDDPYTPVVERDPIDEDLTVLLIGAGFAGLVHAARLVEAGITDLRLVDKAGDVGGVWYWNRYPGAQCDTAAMIYLPLLEETGTVPSRKYVPAPEIFAHAKRIAETFGLYDRALLSTGITDVRWDPEISRWVVRTDRGDVLRARYVITGTGPLSRPKLPAVEGLETFAGPAFHTSRWDYSVTGGSPEGEPMTALQGKRVGIIGTGATAVQAIPHLAASAGELYVFQRTPSSVDTRGNVDIDPDWFADLQPGWQKEWQTNFATLQTGGITDVDLVEDGWTDISSRIRDAVIDEISKGAEFTPETVAKAFGDADDLKMDEIRARVDEIVTDPATAEALKPWYRQLCKRPCFSDEYLEAYNLPTTHIVDTEGKGVAKVDAEGVWVGDEHYPLDVLVIASGFEFGTDVGRRSGYEITGPAGETLAEHWADGQRTLHGMHTHGFPNLFIAGLTQAGNLISNVPHNYVESATTIAAIIAHAEAVGAVEVEPGEEAEEAWLALLLNGSALFGNPECTPGYYNNEGRPIDDAARKGMAGYPGGAVAYFTYLDAWRDKGTFEGVDFR